MTFARETSGRVPVLFAADTRPATAFRRFRCEPRVSTVNPIPGQNKSAPLTRGSGSLEVEMVAGQSTVTSVRAANPLKILVPRPRGTSVWAYQSSFGGGLVAGDETKLNVRLARGARCFLSTQASTKVYRNPDNRPCGHVLNAALAEDSLLVLAPDPVQAFAGSAYVQRQEFRLATGAGLVLVDWMCSGRVAFGERWAFSSFRSRYDLFLEDKHVLVDSLLLDSSGDPPTVGRHMGRFNCVASVLITGVPFQEAGAELLQEISEQGVRRQEALLCTASPITGGVLIRLAGEQVESVAREIQGQLDFLPGFLDDDPWARKW